MKDDIWAELTIFALNRLYKLPKHGGCLLSNIHQIRLQGP